MKSIHEAADNRKEVGRYAELMLEKAGVHGRLPTPVDQVVDCARLMVAKDVVLSEKHVPFFTRQYKLLVSALRKAVGLIDLRQKIIYLDTTVLPQRQGFVKLHEVGHEMLPWQRKAHVYLDDEDTLSPEVREMFEQEANWFAADMLFQLDRFEIEARDMPLALKSPMALADRYHASKHAAIRRFVERNRHPCAVLIFELVKGDEVICDRRLRLKIAIQSGKFRDRFGENKCPEYPDVSFAFVGPILRGCRFLQDGEIAIGDRAGKLVDCAFHVFNSSYSVFVFIYPFDVGVRARTHVVVLR
jgi:hypothetical protein